MKSVIKKAENFSFVSKTDDEQIYGRAAIEYKLAEYGGLSHTFDLKEKMGRLGEFRRFEFLLDVTQRTRVGEWLQASLASATKPVYKPGADEPNKCSDASSSTAIVVSSLSVGGASSSWLLGKKGTPSLNSTSKTALQKKRDEAADAHNATILTVFGPKKIHA